MIKIDVNNNVIKYFLSVDNIVYNKMFFGLLNFNIENISFKKNFIIIEKWIKFCIFISLF